jgi:hypothetical protein
MVHQLHELVPKHFAFASPKDETQDFSCYQSLPCYHIHILDDLHLHNNYKSLA